MSDAPLFRSRVGVVLLVIAGGFLVIGLTRSATPPAPTSGPAGSSYATDRFGTAALVDLLVANDYSVVRERRPLETHPPASDDVVVIVNGNLLSLEDRMAISDFLTHGGRLVAIGTTWLDDITELPPTRVATTDDLSHGVLPAGGFSAVEQVLSDRVWAEAGSLVPLVGNHQGVAAGIEYVGGGTVVAIADDGVVSNDLLDVGDHALLALLAIGETEGSVRFLEYIHGFTQPTGLSALPARWKQALLLLTLAGFIWLAARGRRLGPPEEASRELAPPRSAYVDALAITLEASKDPAAVAPLDAAIRTELARRGADTGSSSSLYDAAQTSGVDEGTVRSALGPHSGRDEARDKAVLLSHIINKEQL